MHILIAPLSKIIFDQTLLKSMANWHEIQQPLDVVFGYLDPEGNA